MDALAKYILVHSKRVHDMEWLKRQFEVSGLPTDLSPSYLYKKVAITVLIWQNAAVPK